MGRKGKTGRGAGGHHKMEDFGNGVVRRPIEILNAAKELEAITGVEAINTRQASTIQDAISGVRCDVMSFRHQYETAERLLPRLIRRLEELESPNP